MTEPLLPALAPKDAAAFLGNVNRTRMRLARRLAELDLFVTRTQPTAVDLPMVQVILRLRDAVERIPDSSPAVIPALTALSNAICAAQKEANTASVEVQSAMQQAAALEQKAREHQDKMSLLRAKSTTDTLSAADLLRLVEDKEPSAHGEIPR